MRWSSRVLGAVVLALASLGVVCCATGAVGVWVVRPELSRRAETLDARVAAALERASAANEGVRRALKKARADVRRVSKGSAGLGPEPLKNRRVAGLLRKQIQRKVGPNIDDLGGRLARSSAAAVVSASLLHSLQELPLGAAGPLDPNKLGQAADQASQLSAALRKLQAVIGEGDQKATAHEVAAAAAEMDRVLQKCQARSEDWQADLDAARDRQAQLRARLPGWLLLGAVAVTVLCAWVGVSQVSLAAHAWKWLRAPGGCHSAHPSVSGASGPAV
jgi:hypothetical protein